MPVASDWTGDPLGVTWNLPTAAVQNAARAFVATLAPLRPRRRRRCDPGRDKRPHDQQPGHLRCHLHRRQRLQRLADDGELSARAHERPPRRQGAGAGPVHPVRGRRHRAGGHHGARGGSRHAAMVTADLAVAQQLDAEAAAASGPPPPRPPPRRPRRPRPPPPGGLIARQAPGTREPPAPLRGPTDRPSGGLAVTGSNPIPLAGLGVAFLVCGETGPAHCSTTKGQGMTAPGSAESEGHRFFRDLTSPGAIQLRLGDLLRHRGAGLSGVGHRRSRSSRIAVAARATDDGSQPWRSPFGARSSESCSEGCCISGCSRDQR